MSLPPTPPRARPSDDRPVVTLVIIGDELLSGKIIDANTPFLLQRLNALGARLREICLVEDDLPTLAATLTRVREVSDHVLTTGGIGPTHDDVTLDAAAHALAVPLVESPALLTRLAAHFAPAPLTPGQRRLARIPAGASLMWAPDLPFPVIRAANLWLFPGIPAITHALFDAMAPHFAASTPRFAAVLDLLATESTLCEALDALVVAHPTVAIGSYPSLIGATWRLRLTFDGGSASAVTAAHAAAHAAFAAYLLPTPLPASTPAAPPASRSPLSAPPHE